MGRIFARVGLFYSWATPEYLLDHMSMDQILMYYEYGMEHEENKAIILTNKIALLFGAEEKKEFKDQTPDKKAFYDRYGNVIKQVPKVR